MKYSDIQIAYGDEEYLNQLCRDIEKYYGLEIDWEEINFNPRGELVANQLIKSIAIQVIEHICKGLDTDMKKYITQELINSIRPNCLASTIDMPDLDQYDLSQSDQEKIEELSTLL